MITPAQVATLKLKLPNRWMSISQGVLDQVSEHRHIVPRGTLTSLCGFTPQAPQVWRGISSSQQPRCFDCAAVAIGGSDA